MRQWVMWIVVIGMFAFAPAVMENAAQPPSSCPAAVETALTELARNCDDLGRNTACYGNFDVDSTFFQPVDEAFFTAPSDQAPLVDLQSIITAPLDLAAQKWGLAVLNAQADIPNTIPGQGITILLMGDAEVENRVSPDEAQVGIDPIEITAVNQATIRSAPGVDSPVMDTLSSDLQVLADAVDASREWIRILYNDQPAWIAIGQVAESPEVLGALPAVSAESQSPMQAFYFTTGIGATQCQEAPDVVTIRSNESLIVNLNVNGADIRIGSTINFKSLENGLIAITVVEGHMEIVDTGEIVEAGFTIIARLDDDGTIIEWVEVREATEEELWLGEVSQAALAAVLTGEVRVVGPFEVIHIVVAGENLFRIGMQYQASLPEIVERNGLRPPYTIFIGQRLIIPNPGSGFVNFANSGTTQNSPEVTPDTTGALSCDSLRATSPLDGMAYGMNTFYWDGIAEATSYQVVVTNGSNGQVAVFPTSGPETSLTVDIDEAAVGPGFAFSWVVQPLIDGQVVCTSGTAITQRAAQPLAFTASWSCVVPDVTITFANAQPGELITVQFGYNYGSPPTTPVTLRGTGPSGSLVSSPYDNTAVMVNGVVSGPISGSVSLPSIVCP